MSSAKEECERAAENRWGGRREPAESFPVPLPAPELCASPTSSRHHPCVQPPLRVSCCVCEGTGSVHGAVQHELGTEQLAGTNVLPSLARRRLCAPLCPPGEASSGVSERCGSGQPSLGRRLGWKVAEKPLRARPEIILHLLKPSCTSHGADPALAAASWSLLQPWGGGFWGCSQLRAELSVLSSRIKRIRDKYEVELQELERSERKLQERCNELKGRLAELEGESSRLQGLLKHREQELEEIRKVKPRAQPGPPRASGTLGSPLCPPVGAGPAGPGAEQPGGGDPGGVRRQAGGHGGGEQEAEGGDGGDASPAAPGAGQGGAGEGQRAGGGAQEVRQPGRAWWARGWSPGCVARSLAAVTPRAWFPVLLAPNGRRSPRPAACLASTNPLLLVVPAGLLGVTQPPGLLLPWVPAGRRCPEVPVGCSSTCEHPSAPGSLSPALGSFGARGGVAVPCRLPALKGPG